MTKVLTDDELKSYLCSDRKRQIEKISEFKLTLRNLIKNCDYQKAFDLLSKVLGYGWDYCDSVTLYKLFRVLIDNLAPEKTKRLAILGTSTTQQLGQLVELALCSFGIRVKIFEADYGLVEQEILDSNSELNTFKPDFVLIWVNHLDVKLPALSDSSEQITTHIETQVNYWHQLWNTLNGHHACQIVQNNFVLPEASSLGNLAMSCEASTDNVLRAINKKLILSKPAYVNLFDAESMASRLGRNVWFDPQAYYDFKTACSLNVLPDVSYSIASLIAASLGIARKCLILDLDNTLWGGVIGDDGLGGINLGQGDAQGEAFLAFQRYVLELKNRGILLCVCSKNEENNAREVFIDHPEMILKLDDFSCFVANWNDKVSNLKYIADELNIGLDALVFFDDNPVERALVRQFLPQVAVPEVSGDPSQFIRELQVHNYFESLGLSKEDLERSQKYQQNTQRVKLKEQFTNLDDYLKSLNMLACVNPVNEKNIVRVTQLVNKTNQFNLTTKRYSQTQIEQLTHDPQWETLTVSLKDDFGDNGLIAALLLKSEGEFLEIDTWLMSCRVLKRQVEQFIFNQIVKIAKRKDARFLRGLYIPTKKNMMTADLYDKLGFSRVQSQSGSTVQWIFDLETTVNAIHYIRSE